MEYTVEDLRKKLGLTVSDIARKIKVHRVTLNKWMRQNEGKIPEKYHDIIENLLLKKDGVTVERTPLEKPYTLDAVCEYFSISKKKLANILDIDRYTPSTWEKKRQGQIPEIYYEKIEAMIRGEKTPKKHLPKQKHMEVQEIKEAPEQSSPVVALVGNPNDVLKVLREMKFTKD